MGLSKFIGVIVISLPIMGQTVIWKEDFNSYSNGAQVGENHNTVNPDPDWFTGGCMACADTADWWEVRSGRMEARDVNQLVFLQSEEINIASFTNVGFSIEVSESGDHEGPYFLQDHCGDQDKEDFVNVSYRIDGGAWVMISNYLSWCGLYDSCGTHTLYGDDGGNSGDCRDHDNDWGNATVMLSGLSGNNLELRIEAINSATTEFINIDNIQVEGSIVLPVTLTTFSLEQVNYSVQLHWQTVSEINNNHFIIERSKFPQGGHWETIETVDGLGNSYEITDYQYTDFLPLAGQSFYRLKQVDFDGEYHYSTIESIYLQPLNRPFPNPSYGFASIPFNDQSNPPTSLFLYDSNAKRYSISVDRDHTLLRLNLQTLPVGNYFFILDNVKHRIIVRR